MAERVDVWADAVEPARRQPSSHLASLNAEIGQLPATHYAKLALGEPAQPTCVSFLPDSGRNLTQTVHCDDLWGSRVPRRRLRRPFIAEIVPRHARTRLEEMSDEAAPTPVEERDDELATEAGEPEGIDPEALERRSAALSQVVKFGDPVLRSAASPVTEFDDRLAAEADRMIGLMRDAIGVGLAATQLGTLRRMLVFQVGSEAEPTVLVNPEIEWRSEEEVTTAEEGCLSLPGVIVDVERPLHVRARGADVHGEPFSLEASGLEARVIQHEVDHLDGVLMIDRTEREQRRGALRALREGGTFAPEAEESEAEESEAGDGAQSSEG